MGNETRFAGHLLSKAKGPHQEIIDELLSDFPEAKTRGFMRALRSLPDASYTVDLLNENDEWRKWINFTPDAYWIDTPERAVAIYEAVHSHDISERKFARMNDLAWALDEDCWNLILVRADRFGGRAIWNVKDASFVAMMEAIDRGEPDADRSWAVANWQKYTVQYCNAYLEARAA